MSLLADLKIIIEPLVPVETGVFSEAPPDSYTVLTPIVDSDELFCDNLPSYEIQEVRISLFANGNYTTLKNTVIKALRSAGLTITDKRYIGRDDSTGYHNYAIDVAQQYEIMED